MSEYKVREFYLKINLKFISLCSLRFVTEEKVLEIEVEAGVADGYQIPFLAEGLILYKIIFYLIIKFCYRRTSY
jgi:hypothetical protein